MPLTGRPPLSHPTRRQVAASCAAEPRTIYALGKKLDRSPGSLTAVVRRMVRDEMLEEVRGRRRTAYLTTPAGRAELARLESEESEPGRLAEGDRVLAIALSDLPAQREILKLAAANVGVRWAARVDGSYRLLIAIASEAPDVLDWLEGAFSGAGARCAYGRIDLLLTRRELDEYARVVTLRDESSGADFTALESTQP